MQIDTEITNAFERIADRLHARIDEVAKEGREQSKEILEEVQTTRRETTAVGVKLAEHVNYDENQFARIDGELDKLKKKAEGQAIGMARLGGASVAGGGLVATFIEFFRRAQE